MDAQEGLGEEGGMKEEGGGWEVEEDLDLPPELVRRAASNSVNTRHNNIVNRPSQEMKLTKSCHHCS